MKIRLLSVPAALALCLLFAGQAGAHFGMVIPDKPSVTSAADSPVHLSLKFWHPFANVGMDLEKPAEFKVYHDEKAVNLLPSLKEEQEQGRRTWGCSYAVKKPGLYVFAMEPKPYYEEAEDCFIIHYTKVCVDAFGDDEGWDKPIGLKAEIVPMTRPGALYVGNVFQGRVLLNGEPVPNARVEVEWYPGSDLCGVAPYPSMSTQTVKADAQGVFTYAAPVKGWWGFAALLEGDEKIAHGGAPKDVELGAVIWVRFHTMLEPVLRK